MATTKRQKLLGSTVTGKLLRAVLLAAVIGAGGVVADAYPPLRPFVTMAIGVLTGVFAPPPTQAPPVPEKATPPANEPAPNRVDPGAATKKG